MATLASSLLAPLNPVLGGVIEATNSFVRGSLKTPAQKVSTPKQVSLGPYPSSASLEPISALSVPATAQITALRGTPAPAPAQAKAPVPAPVPAPQPTYDFSQDALTPQANVSGSVDAMLGQVQPAQKPFVNTYWDPGLGKYVEGNMETDRPWEKYGLGSANALYNTDPNTLRALQQRNTIGGQYGEYIQSQIKPIDEEAIRRQTMDRFQAEIDAMNRYYAEKTAGELAREQEAGRGRVGTRTAISARRGMLGGDFGDSARETVVRYNQDVENRIVNLNEKERIFQELQMRGAATEAAEKAIDKAKKELESAYDKSQKWQEKIKGEIQERVTNRLSALALDGEEMSDDDYARIATELGIDVDTVKATALAMRPEAEKPLIVGGVAYQRQADGTYKAITPSEGEKPLIVGGVAYQKQPDGSYSPITPTEAQKPIVVDGVIYERDASGNYVAKTPTQGAGTKAPETVKINGVDSVWDGEKFVPVKVQPAVLSPEMENRANEIKRLAAKLLGQDEVLKNVVGPVSSVIPPIRQDSAQFKVDLQRLNSLLTIENLDLMKGVLTDKDIEILRSAASGLDISGSEQGFRDELKRLRDLQIAPTPQAPTSRVPQSAVDANRQFYPDFTDDEIREVLSPDFPSVGGDTNPATGGNTPYLKTMGAITGIDGSPLWKHGLDIDLKIGDPVKSPISGTVIATKTSPKGFGKQVRVKGDDGNEYWFSHLDGFDVNAGAKIKVGQVLGRGGNTGSVIPMGGGDGSHLDLTVKDKNGKYIPPREIKKMLDKVMV